jgi:ABC-type antimicrobial peptide transport system permease subunit
VDNKTATVNCRFNIVGEDYFKTLGIPLVRGRAFLAGEVGGGKTAPVAIVDKLSAERLWPKGDAVGQRIRMDTPGLSKSASEAEVVGVVASTQENIFGQELSPHVYVPFGQEYQADMNIHLKIAAGNRDVEARVLDAVRREIRAMDDRLPVLALRTFRDHLDASFDIWAVRTGARMFTLFGGVAVLLAMIGLYGVRAYTVARRTREIGIRMALGADARDAMRMIMREGVSLTAVGVGVGLVLSLIIGKVLSSFLYRVRGVDPLVLTTAPILLATAALLACYFPARRAAHVDPMVALRDE